MYISVAPAQGNATSVQYNAVPLKNDVPFPKDATNIEFDPNKPLLTLVSADPVDRTLDFYRRELGTLGWSLWSQKLNGVQPPGGTSGELSKSGAYAYYLQGDRRLAALVLERAEAGRTKVKFEELPAGYLESLQKEFFNSDNIGAALADVSRLPRLDGAKEDATRSSSDSLVYSVAGSLAENIAAIRKTLAADGWQEYVAPLDEPHRTLLAFKKGAQGLSVSFTIQVGKTDQTSEQTTVYFTPARLRFALAIPGDATDIVFDENRPYLNCISAGTVDATLEFYRKALSASGWGPLSAADAAKQWPTAKLDATSANGAQAYFIRERSGRFCCPYNGATTTNRNRDQGPPVAECKSLRLGRISSVCQGRRKQNVWRRQRRHGANRACACAGRVSTVLAFYRRELRRAIGRKRRKGRPQSR